jgi:hypothetical protein
VEYRNVFQHRDSLPGRFIAKEFHAVIVSENDTEYQPQLSLASRNENSIQHHIRSHQGGRSTFRIQPPKMNRNRKTSSPFFGVSPEKGQVMTASNANLVAERNLPEVLPPALRNLPPRRIAAHSRLLLIPQPRFREINISLNAT